LLSVCNELCVWSCGDLILERGFTCWWYQDLHSILVFTWNFW
jgi:hypothetical protein